MYEQIERPNNSVDDTKNPENERYHSSLRVQAPSKCLAAYRVRRSVREITPAESIARFRAIPAETQAAMICNQSKIELTQMPSLIRQYPGKLNLPVDVILLDSQTPSELTNLSKPPRSFRTGFFPTIRVCVTFDVHYCPSDVNTRNDSLNVPSL